MPIEIDWLARMGLARTKPTKMGLESLVGVHSIHQWILSNRDHMIYLFASPTSFELTNSFVEKLSKQLSIQQLIAFSKTPSPPFEPSIH